MQDKTPSLHNLQDGNGGQNILNKLSNYNINYN
jgi:hypothetical protein